MTAQILLIDDDEELCAISARQLRSRGFEVTLALRLSDAEKLLQPNSFDVVVTDVNMPDGNGIEFAARIHEKHPNLPVIVITSYGSMEAAIAALRAGAYDFITKPIELELLHIALKRAVETRALKQELQSLKRLLAEPSIPGFIGDSAPMKRLFTLIAKTAATDVTALITGESGTGKEMVARSIHQQSKRHLGPFVAINCTALPEPLLESELFGHAKGAFTDAKTEHQGLLQQAHGGTLFLDEIGDMPVGLQSKLLRVLEQKTFRPVGAGREISFDARIISATNTDLAAAVSEKSFREDLYYRLNVLHLEMPPLRERGRDVLLLAQHFIDELSTKMAVPAHSLSHDAARKMLGYPWPGNVRELKNCIERALALSETAEITPADLPERIVETRSIHQMVSAEPNGELMTLDDLEKQYIQKILTIFAGNKAQAAKVLGIERKSLYRKLERMKD